jgi:hypothetical protein
MTTYSITATWGAMKLSEEMDITSDLTPENESHYAENFILDKWIRLFGDQFIKAADKITAEAVKPENCSSSSDEIDSLMDDELVEPLRFGDK